MKCEWFDIQLLAKAKDLTGETNSKHRIKKDVRIQLHLYRRFAIINNNVAASEGQCEKQIQVNRIRAATC